MDAKLILRGKENVRMLKKNCLLDIKEKDGVLTVSLGGEIDHHSAVLVRTEIDDKIIKLKPKVTVLDLSGIDFMDSSGLGLIMGRYAKMRAIGGELLLREPNQRVIGIIKLAGLEKMVKIQFGSKKEEDGE